MRKSLVGSISALLTGAGLALAQPAPPPRSLPIVLPTTSDGTTPAPAPSGTAPPSGMVASPTDPATGLPMSSEMGHEPPLPAPGRFFTDGEYLYWFTRPTKLPPLVLEGAAAAPGLPPAVNAPGTVVLVGDENVNANPRSGMRLRAGYWFDADETFGLEASALWLQPVNYNASVVSNNTTTLGLSFRDAFFTTLKNQIETSLIFASPDTASGTSLVHTTTKFWGADINAACNMAGASWYRADALIGFRYLRLQEDFEQDTTTTALPTPTGSVKFLDQLVFAPASVAINDSFHTANDFYGAQVGAHLVLQRGMWFADFRGLLAAGVSHEVLTTTGSTTLTTPAGVVSVPGGLYVQTTNMGQFTKNEFTIVPEGIVSVGCQITHNLRAYLGYSALYWREGVFRPTSEIDRFVSSAIIPTFTPAPPQPGTIIHPAPQLQHVDFWAQGIQLGIELDF